MAEFLVILALILVNGFLAGAELAIVAIRGSRLEELVRGGSSAARAAQRLRATPERFLATVQVGITVAGAAAAALGGASLAGRLEPVFARLGAGAAAAPLAFVAVVGTVSYLSVVLGELVPKSLGLRSERYALLAARPLLALAWVGRPIVWFLTASSNLVLKPFKDSTTFSEVRVSPEELRTIVSDAARQGAVPPAIKEIATRAIDFAELHASDVMIHRRFVVALPVDADPARVRAVFEGRGHQRIPLYDGTIDNVVGYLSWRDVLARVWAGEAPSLAALKRPALFVPEAKLAVDLLKEMRATRNHLAIVVDEHGGMEGLVTLEDLLEELVGEIYSEHAAPAGQHSGQQVLREPGGSFVVTGLAPLREVNRETGLALDEPEEVATVSGLCVQLNDERVPIQGAVLEAGDGTRIEVLDASPRRVRSVRLRPRPREEAPPVGAGELGG